MDIDRFIEKLKDGKILTQRELRAVCLRAKDILAEESNVVQVKSPVTVAGDIHGQFFDLLKLFSIGGELPGINYIFVGDFVDRGAHSVETMSLLLCYKVKYPSHLTLLRGNHETRHISCQYGFSEEIRRKYGNEHPWTLFTDVFDFIPIAAIIDNDTLCLHGGLSPEVKTLDQIRLIDRCAEVPLKGSYSDILWSDPSEQCDGFRKNMRGCGWVFGAKPTKEFNHRNGLKLIARAHQLVQEGYDYCFPEQSLVTVWSAPNYMYKCANKASIMKVDEYLEKTFSIFEEAPVSHEVTEVSHFFPYFL